MKFYNVFSGVLTGATKEAFKNNIGDKVFNSLHSYWYVKNLTDEKIKEAFELTIGNIMIDSGAFTAWEKDINIDVEKYLKWINKWDKYVTIFGQIDVIPPKNATPDEINKCCQETWQNYLYMYERMNSPQKLLYTFHFGEPIEYLKQALEWRDKEGKPMEYMAFGGLVGRTTEERTRFLDRAFITIYNSSNPNIKIHGFGVSSAKLWNKYPFESCDSFTPGLNASRGFECSDIGNYRNADYKKIFKSRAKTKEEKLEVELIETVMNKKQELDEVNTRTNEMTKLLIKNIEYWTNLANNIPNPRDRLKSNGIGSDNATADIKWR